MVSYSMSVITGLFQHFSELRTRLKGVTYYYEKGCHGLTDRRT